MKNIIFIAIIMSLSQNISAQSNNYKILEDITAVGITWQTSGHILFPDVLVTPTTANILVSTETKGANSFIRLQKYGINFPYAVSFDYYIQGLNDKETAIAIDADQNANYYIVAGNTLNTTNHIASGVLAQITPGGGLFKMIQLNITDPAGEPFDNTYILDLKTARFAADADPGSIRNYYIVGYIADGTNSLTSLKKPFIACYDNNLSFVWSKVIDQADVDNNFSAIEICSNPYSIIASGCTRELISGAGTYSRMITSVQFDVTGPEMNNLSFYSNAAGVYSDADHSRVADLLYQEFPHGATPIAPSVVILSYNDIDQGITLSRLDLSTFAVSGSFSSNILSQGLQFNPVGFELMNIDNVGNMAVAGYDKSAAFSFPNPLAWNTFISYHDPITLYGNNYLSFDIDNTGYELLNNDPYFKPLGASVTAPDAFFPSLAYNIKDPNFYWNVKNSIFIGSSRLKLIGTNNNLHHSVINNYNQYNPSAHCVSNSYTYNLNSSSNYQQTQPTEISTASADINANITLLVPPGRTCIPDLSCPPTNTFKRSGIDKLKEESSITIFPNPSADIIEVKGLATGDYSFKIYDIRGDEFMTKSISNKSSDLKIDIHTIPQGMYFISCINDKKQMLFNQKIIKQ